MAFQLSRDKSCRKGLRRTVCKQIDGALRLLKDKPPGGRDEAVHEARRRFKKIRAVLRLVRLAVGEKTFAKENACFRAAGRPLTEVRDAKILGDAVEKLAEAWRGRIAAHSFDEVNRALHANLRAVHRRVLDEEKAFAVVADLIREARDRVPDWTDVRDKWSSLGQGLEQTYDRARAAFDDAAADPTMEKLHEWRKLTKYHRYQLKLLGPLWDERVGEQAEESHRLGSLLGDDHDLAVLQQRLTDGSLHVDDEAGVQVLTILIDERRPGLQQEALELGRRYFSERPQELAHRFKAYWKSWRTPPEPIVAGSVQ